jgi:hypothetical protein
MRALSASSHSPPGQAALLMGEDGRNVSGAVGQKPSPTISSRIAESGLFFPWDLRIYGFTGIYGDMIRIASSAAP